MIELLKPLGLLGLLSVAILIIIYIIRPNFQQKLISSTFVWKLSLKYRKKRVPISKLRNILIIVCQVLILTASALILSEPVKNLKQEEFATEVIAIIDASASMRTTTENVTRFERAVDGVSELTDDILKKNGVVSVILAGSKAEYLIQRNTIENKETITEKLESLLLNEMGDVACSYGESDVEGAIALCEKVLEVNPSAMIYLYTDTTYDYVPAGVKVKNDVAQEGEWNMAILNATAELEDIYYTFYVDVACYGRNTKVDVEVQIQGANAQDSTDKGSKIKLVAEGVECYGDATKRIVFIDADYFQGDETETDDVVYVLIENKDEKVFAYQSIYVSITNALSNEKDSFRTDNSFNIYNGQKEVVKIQYASSIPNNFVPAALNSLKSNYQDRWDLQITEVKKGNEYETEGFNFYIFEHSMPQKMPTDGIVFLIDPLSTPEGSGFRAESIRAYSSRVSLLQGETHAILNNIEAELITVTRFVETTYDDTYKHLMYCDGYPVLTVKNDSEAKVVVMGFSLHYSNLTVLLDFPLLFHNIFQYFYPSTVERDSFSVGEKIDLNARGETLTVSREGASEEEALVFDQFPSVIQVTIPGTYTLTQTTLGNKIKESIFVTIPKSESNIWSKEDSLVEPYKVEDDTIVNQDLLLYIAAALVAILFLEWLLQIRDNM